MQITVGGIKLTFYGTIYTPTSNLTTSKLHWNRVLSIPVSKHPVVDIKNFYLNNPMSKHEYYKTAISLIPQDFINKYELTEKQINSFFYVRVEKSMYGLVQADIIVHTSLNKRLLLFGYETVPITTSLWRHNTSLPPSF